MRPGVVILKTHARRQQTTAFFFDLLASADPNHTTVLLTVPRHQIITSCFMLRKLYGFVGIHLNDLRALLRGRIWQKHLRCIVTYNSEAPEQHIDEDEGSCIVGKHWPNTLVICAQKVVLQPDCIWLHFGFVTAAFVSHYS